jgi:hypothetical protein
VVEEAVVLLPGCVIVNIPPDVGYDAKANLYAGPIPAPVVKTLMEYEDVAHP